MSKKAPVECCVCGQIVYRTPSQIVGKVYCSRACFSPAASARMSNYNRTTNPMNTSSGWTEEMRSDVREREKKNKGPCQAHTYPKRHGKHEHRAVAEEMIGRKLRPGEVVHHVDGNKHNNDPKNLVVFDSQGAHAAFHARKRQEVMQNDISE